MTLAIHPWGNKAGGWVDNTLEKTHTAPSKEEMGILSVRVAQAGADVFASGYELSVKAPTPHPTFRVSVLNNGRTVWTRAQLPSGNIAMLDEWPRFASAGAGKNGLPTAGWAFSSPRRIHLPTGSHAKMDTTVMGDQVRVALEGKKAGSAGILRLHCSPGIDSMRVQSIRAGLFNLAQHTQAHASKK